MRLGALDCIKHETSSRRRTLGGATHGIDGDGGRACGGGRGSKTGAGVRADYAPGNFTIAAWYETARGGARESVEVVGTVAPARAYCDDTKALFVSTNKGTGVQLYETAKNSPGWAISRSRSPGRLVALGIVGALAYAGHE